MNDTLKQRTSNLWGEIAARRQHTPLDGWLDSPLVQELYVRKLIGMVFTSGADKWIAKLVETHHIPRGGRWLSVGCAGGAWELFVAEQGLCSAIDGLDISPEAIGIAREHARGQGIANAHFYVADVERERLPERAYDVVLFSMSLHHIERLEYFLAEVANALKPGGAIIMNEFIGPSRWQWSDAQLAAINELLAWMPEKYRYHHRLNAIKEREERPGIEYMKHLDPSESVRSAEIVPFVERLFCVERVYGYGGPVLHKLLEYIVGNFDAANEEDVALLKLLFAAEQSLIKLNILRDEFAVVVARNAKGAQRAAKLPFDDALAAHVVDGVYELERTPEGKPLVWTSRAARFVLRRPEGAGYLLLEMRLPPVATGVVVVVDGAVACAISAHENRNRAWHTLSIPLREGGGSSQPTIAITVDEPWMPARGTASPDRRELGVAIARLEFSAAPIARYNDTFGAVMLSAAKHLVLRVRDSSLRSE